MTEEALSPSSPDAPKVLTTVYLSTFFIRFGFGITLSLFAFYLSATAYSTGLAAALAPALEASTVVVSGILADRFGRFPVLRVGLLLGAAMLLLMSTTRDPFDEAVLNALFGVASGAILASSLAITGDLNPQSSTGHAMGWFDAVNLFGWIAGFGSGYITVFEVHGVEHPAHLTVAFWIGAAAVLFAFVIVSVRTRSFREVAHPSILHLDRLRKALLDPDILLVVLPWASIYMLIGALLIYLGPVANAAQLPLWELGLGIFVGGSLLLASQPYYGGLTDRWGRGPVQNIGLVGFLGALASASLLLLVPNNLEVEYGGGAVLGISALMALAFGPSSLAALSDLAARISRGTTMSLYCMVIAAGMSAGIALFYTLMAWQTATHRGNDGVAIFFLIIGGFLVAVVTLRAYRHRRSAVSSPKVPA